MIINKLKILFLVLLCSNLILAQNNVIDEVVWVIGDEAILKSDVEKQILQMKYERIEANGDPYCIVPEQIAIKKLMLHQATLDSIVANESQVSMFVDQRLNEIIAQIGSEEKLEEYYGKSIRILKEELKEQAREQMIIQQVQQKIIGEQKITPSDVRKFFNKEENKANMPMVPTKVEVQIITIEPKQNPKAIEEIKEKLRGFKNRVENENASFSMLATLYSDDLGSAKQGGELGFMGKGQLVQEFAEVAFSLTDPKKVSNVVESEFGYHIIQLIERRGEKVNCRHILLKPKIDEEERENAKNHLDTIVSIIRNGKITFEQAVNTFSHDKDTRMNKGLMMNSQDGTSRFEFQALPTNLAQIAYRMNVGEISDPFFMENAKGKQVCAIIKIKSKIEQHKANLETDYQLLKNIVKEKQNAEIIDNWIKKKQSETYIKISPAWQKCDFKYPNWIP